jgi:hypothetical protein
VAALCVSGAAWRRRLANAASGRYPVLLTSQRLGAQKGGIREIKSHPWFAHMDWDVGAFFAEAVPAL